MSGFDFSAAIAAKRAESAKAKAPKAAKAERAASSAIIADGAILVRIPLRDAKFSKSGERLGLGWAIETLSASVDVAGYGPVEVVVRANVEAKIGADGRPVVGTGGVAASVGFDAEGSAKALGVPVAAPAPLAPVVVAPLSTAQRAAVATSQDPKDAFARLMALGT